jgi:hypothetical protein
MRRETIHKFEFDISTNIKSTQAQLHETNPLKQQNRQVNDDL